MRVPESDDARAAFMSTAIRTPAADAAKGITYIPGAVITSAATFLNDRTVGGNDGAGVCQPGHATAVAGGPGDEGGGEAQTAEVALDTYVRDYAAVLGAREDHRTVAQELVAGDAATVAMGFPAMVNPGAVELQGKLTE
jgi:hypothetical protein